MIALDVQYVSDKYSTTLAWKHVKDHATEHAPEHPKMHAAMHAAMHTRRGVCSPT